MFSRSKPNAKKKSFASFFKPLLRGTKQTHTHQPEDNNIVLIHPDGPRAPAVYQHMPAPPGIPPYQYSQPIFVPPPVQAIPAIIPSSSFPETPTHQTLQPGPARNSRSTSRRNAHSKGTELHSAAREPIPVPVVAPFVQYPYPDPVLQLPTAVPHAKASDSKASKRSHSSKQAAPVKPQIPLAVSAKTAEPSLNPPARNQNLHGDVVRPSRHDNQTSLKPRKREPKPPSAEYLATPLSDNPLGLTDMVPVEKYGAPQGNDAITTVSRSRTRQVPAVQVPVGDPRHTTSRITSSSASQNAATSQASGQVKERLQERDSSGRKSHHQSSLRGHHSAASESPSATIVTTSNPPSHQSTTSNANKSPTYPASVESSQLSEIMCLVENPHMDLRSPIRLMSPESITSARVPRSLRTTYTG